MDRKPNFSDLKYQTKVFFGNYDYILFNTFVFHWESDFIASAKQTGYVIEIEMKMSRSDFNADFNKIIKGWGKIRNRNKHDYLRDSAELFKPNKFGFACPEGLIKPEELPKEYGLYWMPENGGNLVCVKTPKFLHKTDLFKDNHFVIQMMNKFYYRNIDLRVALGLREYDIKYNQRRLYEETYY